MGIVFVAATVKVGDVNFGVAHTQTKPELKVGGCSGSLLAFSGIASSSGVRTFLHLTCIGLQDSSTKSLGVSGRLEVLGTATNQWIQCLASGLATAEGLPCSSCSEVIGARVDLKIEDGVEVEGEFEE